MIADLRLCTVLFINNHGWMVNWGGRVFEGPGGNLQKCGRGKERGGAETKK